jgi:nitrate reductase cytochrome c-type subunit
MLIRFYLLASSKSESRFIKLIRKKSFSNYSSQHPRVPHAVPNYSSLYSNFTAAIAAPTAAATSIAAAIAAPASVSSSSSRLITRCPLYA